MQPSEREITDYKQVTDNSVILNPGREEALRCPVRITPLLNNILNSFNKLNSLQYLRALCAIAVVFYHAEVGVNKYWVAEIPNTLFKWGELGVPMFFCISGFVITYSGYLRPKRCWEFLYSRLARIYPAYVATASLFVSSLMILPAGSFNSTPNISFEQIARTLLFDFGRTGGYVYVGWTLFYEMTFYIIFSLIIFRFASIARSKLFYYLLSFSLVTCQMLAMTRVADFMIGISIFLLASKTLGKLNNFPCHVLIASLILGAVFHPIGLACGMILLLLLALEQVNPNIFNLKQLLVLGDSSYSIYLVQVLTVSASLKISKLFTLQIPNASDNYLIFYITSLAMAFISTVIAGMLMRKYIEKPSLSYLMSLKN